MKGKRQLYLLGLLCAALLLCTFTVSAQTEGEEAEWTVMFYMCGSDLESRYGYASENLKEIARCTPFFSSSEHELLPGDWNLVDETDQCGLDGVNIVLETGGCREWHVEELEMNIDTSVLQRWHFEYNPSDMLGDYCLDETLPLQNMGYTFRL